MANPFVSVVILTLDDAPNVVACLKKQTFQDFEIIFAREKGIVNAMNKALERARGEIFVRVDNDVELPENWLHSLVFSFKDPDVAGATGPTFVPKDRRGNRDSIRIWENPNSFLRWLADGRTFKPAGIYKCGMVSYDSNYEERFKYFPMNVTMQNCDHLEGTNWAMRTSLIRDVGGFDPKFDGVAEWFDTDVEKKITRRPHIVRNKTVSTIGSWSLVYNPKAYLYHMLEKGPTYHERFQGCGRIKNFLRFHIRHSRFHWKMVIYLLVWIGYFFLAGHGEVRLGEARVIKK